MKQIWSVTKKNKELLTYLIVGILTTLVNWISYAIFSHLYSVTISNCIAWILAVCFSFTLNKFWVFKKNNSKVLYEIITFFSGRLVVGIIETIGLNLLCLTLLGTIIFGIKGLIAKVIMSLVSMVLNYIVSKILVFKKG